MNDLISRQAAIDEIKALYEWHDTVTEDRAVDHLKRLPSAQSEIIRCRDCKHGSPNGRYGCRVYHYKRYETHDMKADDFCSRAERKGEQP